MHCINSVLGFVWLLTMLLPVVAGTATAATASAAAAAAGFAVF